MAYSTLFSIWSLKSSSGLFVLLPSTFPSDVLFLGLKLTSKEKYFLVHKSNCISSIGFNTIHLLFLKKLIFKFQGKRVQVNLYCWYLILSINTFIPLAEWTSRTGSVKERTSVFFHFRVWKGKRENKFFHQPLPH